jgi:hypothetical protein
LGFLQQQVSAAQSARSRRILPHFFFRVEARASQQPHYVYQSSINQPKD